MRKKFIYVLWALVVGILLVIAFIFLSLIHILFSAKVYQHGVVVCTTRNDRKTTVNHLHDTDALFRVSEAPGMHRIKRRFPGMAERRVSEIVAERNGFGQILIQDVYKRQPVGRLLLKKAR